MIKILTICSWVLLVVALLFYIFAKYFYRKKIEKQVNTVVDSMADEYGLTIDDFQKLLIGEDLL